MALYFSSGLRNHIGNVGSYRMALKNGRMVIYSGTVPASADATLGSAVSLVTISAGSGAWTAETRAAAQVTFSWTAGDDSVTAIVVGDNAGVAGIDIVKTTVEIGAAKPYTTLAAFCNGLAAQINLDSVIGGLRAVSDGATKVTLYAPRGVGAVTWGITTTTVGAGDLSAVDEDFGTEVTGLPPAYGLEFAEVTLGILAKSGVWSGVIDSTGTASFFRIYGSIADSGGDDSTAKAYNRVQGTCGTSSGDYIMASTTLTATETHTVDVFNLTLPAS